MNTEKPGDAPHAKKPWNHSKKLTAAKAREIRVRHEAGEAVDDLAGEFGTSRQAIEDVIRYMTWAFAGPAPPGSKDN